MRKIITICLLLLTVMLIASACSLGETRRTPIAPTRIPGTFTPAPAPATTPRVSPTPTQTPVPKPTPTPTPTPSATPRPQLTTAEEAYGLILLDHSKRVDAAFHELTRLILEADTDNQEWIESFATQLVEVKNLYSEALEIKPPDSLKDFNAQYIQGMEKFDSATLMLAEGFDKDDLKLISDAAEKIKEGIELVAEVRNYLGI